MLAAPVGGGARLLPAARSSRDRISFNITSKAKARQQRGNVLA
jgi:hypothetical protein